MRVIHNEYEQQNEDKSKLHAVFATFLIISIIYLISFAMTSVPGTYAWLTSETNASGTIRNATTEDLLTIQSSEVRYEQQCSITHTLKVKNISEMNTVVTVSFSTGSGYEEAGGKKLKPGQILTVKPDIAADTCDAAALTYRIQAFNQYVDETYPVPVDRVKLKETMGTKPEEKQEVKPDKIEKSNQESNDPEGTEPEQPNEKPTEPEAAGEEQQPADETKEGDELSEGKESVDGEENSDQEKVKDEPISDEESPEKEKSVEDASVKDSPTLDKDEGNEKTES
ncbi:hypothetical protein V6B33_06120 [Mangrovibacillus sp. Mu-81]|uniref:hypothetical protein n=1 Tax=Mangrovibacillus sp. Mu-81 TaxID=3121478 RepID=UPI002FE4E15A